MVGGKRNSNVVSALLNNFSVAESALETSANSAGSALSENEKFLDSIQGKLSILKASFEELSNTLIDSGFVKYIVDSGTDIAEATTGIANNLGTFPTLLAAITGIVSARNITKNKTAGLFSPTKDGHFGILGVSLSDLTDKFNAAKSAGLGLGGSLKSSIVPNIKENIAAIEEYNSLSTKSISDQESYNDVLNKSNTSMAEYLKTLDGGKASLKEYNDYCKKTGTGTGTLSIKAKAAAISMNILSTALNMMVSMGIGIAIQAIITGISELIERENELRDAAYDAAQSLDEENQSLETYKQKIIELKEKLDDSTTTESQAYNIKQQLLSVQDELTEKYGDQLGAIDLVNGALKEEIGLLDKAIEKNNSKWKRENFTAIDNAISDTQKDLSYSNRVMPNGTYANLNFAAAGDDDGIRLQRAVADYAVKELGATMDSSNVIFNVKTKKQLQEQMDHLIAFIEEYGDKHKVDAKTMLSGLTDAYSYWFDENYEKNQEIVEHWAQIEAQTNSTFRTLYTEATKTQKKYEEALKSGDVSAQKQMVKSMDKLRQSFKEKEKVWRKEDEYGYVDEEAAAMADFFQDFFDEWDGKTISMQFELDYKGNKNNIKDMLEKSIHEWAGDKTVSDVDLQSLYDGLSKKEPSEIGSSSSDLLYKNLKQAASDYQIEVKDLISSLVELGVVQSDVADKTPTEYDFTHLVDTESDSVKNLVEELGNIKSAYSSVKSVIEDYNETGELTLDSLESLINLGGEYIDYLFDENGNINLNEEAYKALTQAKLNKLKVDVINNAIDNVSKLNDEASATAYLKNKTDELAASEKDAAKATLANALASKYAQGGDVAKAANRIQQETENVLNLIDMTSRGLDTNTDLVLSGSQAEDDYTKSLKDNNKALEKQKDGLDKQKDALDKVKEGLDDTAKALQDDYDNINSLIEQTVTLIKYEQDALKEKYQTEIDGLNEADEAYQDKVDKLKEAIDLEAQEIKNQETLAEKQKSLSDINRELAMLSGDNSSVARSRRNELLNLRSDAQKDLNDTEGEQTREKRKAALDEVAKQHQKMTEIQTEALEKRIDNISDYISREGDVRRDAMKRMDTDSKNLYGQLLSYTLTYTSTSREEYDHMWNLAISALEKYNYTHNGTFAVMSMLQNNIYAVNAKIAQTELQIKGVQSAIDGVSGAIDKNSKALSDYTDRLNEAAKARKSFANSGEENLDLDNYASYINGIRYTTFANNKKEAIQNILDFFFTSRGVTKNQENIDYYKKIISGNIEKYAKGTRRSGNGLAQIWEKGEEFVLDQPDTGKYVPLNSAAVFNNAQTQALWDFSKTPDNFIQAGFKDLIGKFPEITGNWAGIQINAPITVKGDATPEGVAALGDKIKQNLFPALCKELTKEMVKVGKFRMR